MTINDLCGDPVEAQKGFYLPKNGVWSFPQNLGESNETLYARSPDPFPILRLGKGLSRETNVLLESNVSI